MKKKRKTSLKAPINLGISPTGNTTQMIIADLGPETPIGVDPPNPLNKCDCQQQATDNFGCTLWMCKCTNANIYLEMCDKGYTWWFA